MLACRSVHLHVGRRGYADADLLGTVHPDFVFDDFRLQAGLSDFRGHVVGGFLIFRRAGDVRLGGQNTQVLFRPRRIGDGDELLVPLMLRSEIAKAENRRCGLGRGVAFRLLGRGGKYDQRESKNGSESLQFSLLDRRAGRKKKLTLLHGLFRLPAGQDALSSSRSPCANNKPHHHHNGPHCLSDSSEINQNTSVSAPPIPDFEDGVPPVADVAPEPAVLPTPPAEAISRPQAALRPPELRPLWSRRLLSTSADQHT